MKIEKAFNVTHLFSFHKITQHKIRKKISKLDGSRATPVGDIPAEMLKSTIDVHVSLLTKIINSSIQNGCIPNENYRPVSVLSNVSKVFERIMYVQIELL